MDNQFSAYEALGSILARLPFFICLKSVSSGPIFDQEESALQHGIQVAVSTLIRSRQLYQLDDDAVEACASGFAKSLTDIVVAGRIEHKSQPETRYVDRTYWELVFDPGTNKVELDTDEKGRVWRKTDRPFDDLPF